MADTFPEALAESWDIDDLAVATIRTLAIDAVQKANSGHPGMPLGAAPMAHVLWSRHLKFDPADPALARSRPLRAERGARLDAAVLPAAPGRFRPLHRRDRELQAMGQPHARPPRVRPDAGGRDHHRSAGRRVLQRGRHGHGRSVPGGHLQPARPYAWSITARSAWWATATSWRAWPPRRRPWPVTSSWASSWCLYDDNQISIEGCTELAFTEDVGLRFEAYGWQVLTVDDGNDLAAIDRAITAAVAETGKPSLIKVRTVIGYGSPHKAGTAECHGAPLGVEELALTKQALGWPENLSFAVPQRVRDFSASVAARGAAARAGWSRAASPRTGRPSPMSRRSGRRPWPDACPKAGRTRCRSSPPARRSPRAPRRARC